MMTLTESCKLFEIHNINDVNKEYIRKKYLKLCILYHPDKSHDGIESEMFLKVTESYNTLNSYIDIHEKNIYQSTTNNENNVFNTIISLLSIDNIQYILNLIDSYNIWLTAVPEIIKLNVTFEQAFKKSIFIQNNDHYIPLWHNVIHQFSVKEQRHYIYIINITDVPENMRILKNNDIVINIPKKNITKMKYNDVNICKNCFVNVFVDANSYETSYLFIGNRGLPKTNMNDIYDYSVLSNIHVMIV